MENKKTGGPAFPEIIIKNCEPPGATKKIYYSGMTLRDYFAAKAMQGFCANEQFLEAKEKDISKWSYEQADAMLEARDA